MSQTPLQSLQIKYAVGVDPDIDKSGLAVWSKQETRLIYVDAVPFYKLIERINDIPVGEASFFIDAGWLNEGYHHYGGLPDNFSTWSEKSKWAYMAKLGVQVGRNFGVGQVIVNYLRAIHGPDAVHEVRPSTQKWSADEMKRYTGWAKRTNSESRDAARLCFQH